MTESQRVPFQYLFAFRVVADYGGGQSDFRRLFDNGGDRIAQVDVDRQIVQFSQSDTVKRTISVSEIEKLYAHKRQPGKLVIIDKSQREVKIVFSNKEEKQLFHSVLQDLLEGKHPGNRLSVPLIRQATIMKRNRTGFFNIRHATLMPGKLVISRSKSSAPESVVILREATLSLEEKKGYIAVRSGERTTVWKGLNLDDTFKWHDAFLVAISSPSQRDTAASVAMGSKPPRLSTFYKDDLPDRVHANRESICPSQDDDDADDLEPPELDDPSDSPLPPSLLHTGPQSQISDYVHESEGQESSPKRGRRFADAAKAVVQEQKQGSPEKVGRFANAAKAVIDKQKQSSLTKGDRFLNVAKAAVEEQKKGSARSGGGFMNIAKAMVASAREEARREKARKVAQSTIVHVPDDLAERGTEDLESSSSNGSSRLQSSELSSDAEDDTERGPTYAAPAQRWSADAVPTGGEGPRAKPRHRHTGSEPIPRPVRSSLRPSHATAPLPDIAEEASLEGLPAAPHSNDGRTDSHDTNRVRFSHAANRASPQQQEAREEGPAASGPDSVPPAASPSIAGHEDSPSPHVHQTSQGFSAGPQNEPATRLSHPEPPLSKADSWASAYSKIPGAPQVSTVPRWGSFEASEWSLRGDSLLPGPPSVHPMVPVDAQVPPDDASRWRAAVLEDLKTVMRKHGKMQEIIVQLRGCLSASGQTQPRLLHHLQRMEELLREVPLMPEQLGVPACIAPLVNELQGVNEAPPEHHEAPSPHVHKSDLVSGAPQGLHHGDVPPQLSGLKHLAQRLDACNAQLEESTAAFREPDVPVEHSHSAGVGGMSLAGNTSMECAASSVSLSACDPQLLTSLSAPPRYGSGMVDAIKHQLDALEDYMGGLVRAQAQQSPHAPGADRGGSGLKAPAAAEVDERPPIHEHADMTQHSVYQGHAAAQQARRPIIMNPLYQASDLSKEASEVLLTLEGAPATHATIKELVEKIKTTEARLQDAVAGLNTATDLYADLARVHQHASAPSTPQPPPLHEKTESPVETPGLIRVEAAHGEAPTPVMSPVQIMTQSPCMPRTPELAVPEFKGAAWTQLNPLYPASSRSVTPDSLFSHSPRPASVASTPLHSASPSPTRTPKLRSTAPSGRTSRATRFTARGDTFASIERTCASLVQDDSTPSRGGGRRSSLASPTATPKASQRSYSPRIYEGTGLAYTLMAPQWSEDEVAIHEEPDQGDCDELDRRPSASLKQLKSMDDSVMTPYLDQANKQRVDFYEATIFTLRQAGIHVEPHWFGPVSISSSGPRDDPAGLATEEIHKAVENVMQSAREAEEALVNAFKKRDRAIMQAKFDLNARPGPHGGRGRADRMLAAASTAADTAKEQRQSILRPRPPAVSAPASVLARSAARAALAPPSHDTVLGAVNETIADSYIEATDSAIGMAQLPSPLSGNTTHVAPERVDDVEALLLAFEQKKVSEQQLLAALYGAGGSCAATAEAAHDQLYSNQLPHLLAHLDRRSRAHSEGELDLAQA